MDWTLVISILALVASVSALWYSRRSTVAAERAMEIETSRFERERHEAARQARLAEAADPCVTAFGDRHGPRGWNGPFGLRVLNQGQATAGNLRVVVRRADTGNDWDFYRAPWPHDLRPGATIEWPAHVSGSSAVRLVCTLTWTDGSGERTEEVQVALG